MLRRALHSGLFLVFFSLVSSYLFLRWSGLSVYSDADFAYPQRLWIWWPYLFDQLDGSGASGVWLAISGGIAALPIVAVITGRLQGTLQRIYPRAIPTREPIRSPTQSFHHARWATIPEMRRIWSGCHQRYGAIAIGEAYDPQRDEDPYDPHDRRTWGGGGRAPLLTTDFSFGSPHFMLVAGSGAHKSMCLVSSLITWTGGVVILDPADELGPMVADYRRGLGHTVHNVGIRRAGFNVLRRIDINSPLVEVDIFDVVETVCGGTNWRQMGKSEFFSHRGKALVITLLCHLLWAPDIDPELKTLRTLRARLTTSEKEVRRDLALIHQRSPSRLARDLAGGLHELVDETFSGIYANADEDTKWLSVEAYAELVSGTEFVAQDILDCRTDVFISLPLKTLQTTPAVARCIIGSLISAIYEADGNISGRWLFILDEVRQLQYMPLIELARDAARKYGLHLYMIYQEPKQLEQQWGRAGMEAWKGVTRAYAAVNDLETAEELAKSIGTYPVIVRSESQNISRRPFSASSNSQGRSVTLSEQRRYLIEPSEIMHSLREDCQIIMVRGFKPVICGRPIYYRRPEFARLVSRSRFAQGHQTWQKPTTNLSLWRIFSGRNRSSRPPPSAPQLLLPPPRP